MGKTSIDELFGEALKWPSAERAVRLEEACAGDGDLRAEVESLLAAHDRAGEFMADPSLEELPGEGVGATVGRYRLLQLIGEGGFGAVFMAEQRRPVQRRVAVKIIKLGMDTKQVIARFEAERQALAMMDHPNIAKVLDAGSTESGRPYFVMELVRRRPRSRPTATARPADHPAAARALRRGLRRHGSTPTRRASSTAISSRRTSWSPSELDGRPTPKIIDFGIAKATGGRLTEATLFTEFRQFMGTPEYTSPEQAVSGGMDIDTRSDVYSLGVLLYELLTGTTPFEAETLRSAGIAEVARIIKEEEPPRPSTRVQTMMSRRRTSVDTSTSQIAAHRRVDPDRLGSIVRGDLDWIVMKCLEKDRSRRYDTANTLAADIGRHMAAEPVLAAPPSRTYRARKFVSRHRGPVAAGLLVSIVFIVGVIGTGVGLAWALREAERADERAIDLQDVVDFQDDQIQRLQPTDVASLLEADLLERLVVAAELEGLDEQQSAAVIAEFSDWLEKASLPDVSTELIYEGILRPSLEQVDKDFGDRPLVQAQLLHSIGMVLIRIGRPNEATEPVIKALDIRTRELGHANRDRLSTLELAARSLGMSGWPDEAVKLLRDGLHNTRIICEPNDPLLIGMIFQLANMLDISSADNPARRALHEESVALWEEVLSIKTNQEPVDALGIAWAQGQLAIGLRHDDPDRAERLFRESLQTKRDNNDRDVGWTLHQLAAHIMRNREDRDDATWLQRLKEAQWLLEESVQEAGPGGRGSNRRLAPFIKLAACLRLQWEVTGDRDLLLESARLGEEAVRLATLAQPVTWYTREYVRSLIALERFDVALEHLRLRERQLVVQAVGRAATMRDVRQGVELAEAYVELFEAWASAEPTVDHELELELWRSRLDAGTPDIPD